MPDSEPTLSLEWEPAGAWIPLGVPRSVNYKRGKTRTLDTISPGTMHVVLPNGQRQFDPDHNPAVAALQPGVRIRLRLTWDGITHTRFTGFLERITQDFGDPNKPRDAVAELDVIDGLGVLAGAGLDSAYEIEMRAHTPRAWLRLGERRGPYAFDRVGAARGVYVEHLGSIDYGEPGLVGFDEDLAVKFNGGYAGYVFTLPEVTPVTTSWSISFLLQLDDIPPIGGDQMILWDAQRYASAYGFNMWIRNAGLDAFGNPILELWASVRNTATFLPSAVVSMRGLSTDHPLAITLTAEPGQPLKFYSRFDNVSENQAGTNHALAPAYWIIGYMPTTGIILDEFVTYDYALTTGQMLDISHGMSGWEHDEAQVRADKVLDSVGWPTADRDIWAVGDDYLKPMEPSTALEHLLAIESTIEGRLWVTPDGILTLEDRATVLQSNATSQATFTDQPGGLGYQKAGPYTKDWALIANVVRRVNGEDIVTARDQTSIDQYGIRDQSPASEVESLYETLEWEHDLAAWRAAHYSEPVPHIDGLTLMPRNDPADLWPVVLDRDLGERVTFQRTPQGVGAPLVMDAIIEGEKVSIGPKTWTWEYSIDATYAQRYFQFDITLWDAPDWRFSA